MEKIIKYEDLRNFAYSNDKQIRGEIKGIVLHFSGLGGTDMYDQDSDDAVLLTKHSESFVEKMKSDHDITLRTIPQRGHCDLPPEVRIEYKNAILNAF